MQNLKLKIWQKGPVPKWSDSPSEAINRFNQAKRSTAFTLIELLVVISIIGILAALTLTGFNAARKNARDATRKSDLQQYRAALEGYASSNKGNYPNNPGNAVNNSGIFSSDNITNLLVDEYLPEVILPPGTLAAGVNNYFYAFGSSPNRYVLGAYLETGGMWQICSDGKAGKPTTGNVDENCDL